MHLRELWQRFLRLGTVVMLCAAAIWVAPLAGRDAPDGPDQPDAPWEALLGGFDRIGDIEVDSEGRPWAGGSNLIRPAGIGWRAVDGREVPARIVDLELNGPDRGWASMVGGMQQLVDGRWLTPQWHPERVLYDLAIPSAAQAWAVGGGLETEHAGFYALEDGSWQLKQAVDGATEAPLALWLDGDGGGWAVGLAGHIYRLRDGIWISEASPVTTTLTEIEGRGPQDVWAAGGSRPSPFEDPPERVFLHFDGQRWSIRRQEARLGIGAMEIQGDRGMAVGYVGEILELRDGDWRTLDLRVPSNRFFQVGALALLPEPGAALIGTGDGRIYRVAQSRLVQEHPPANPRIIEIAAEDIGWAVGRGRAMQWDGEQWTPLPEGHPLVGMRDVDSAGAREAWAVGEGGRILHFDGDAWTQVQSPTRATLDRVQVLASGSAWAAGSVDEPPPRRAVILRYDGRSWETVYEAASSWEAEVTDLDATEDGDVWAVSGGHLWHFDGDGLDWVPSEDRIATVDMQASDRGWAGAGGSILRWDGSGWTETFSIPAGASVSRIRFESEDRGWAIGHYGYVFHFDGSQWRVVRGPADPPTESGTPTEMYDLSLGPSGDPHLWVVGSNASILRASRESLIERPPIQLTRHPTPEPPFVISPTATAEGTRPPRNTPGPRYTSTVVGMPTRDPAPIVTSVILPRLLQADPDAVEAARRATAGAGFTATAAVRQTATVQAFRTLIPLPTPTGSLRPPGGGRGCPVPIRPCPPCPACTETPVPGAGTPTVCPECRH